MEYLPVIKDGKKVYAGFWKRFCASIVDMFIFMIVAYLCYHIKSINIAVAVIGSVILAAFFSFYSIYFNLKYGGTLGKLSVGIRVTKPDGNRIDFKEAFLRSIVDIVYGICFASYQIYAILHVNSEAYLAAGYIEKTRLLLPLYPEISRYTATFNEIWYWSELVVLLFNKRRRALHDFIAGTVVIQNEFAHNKALESRRAKTARVSA